MTKNRLLLHTKGILQKLMSLRHYVTPSRDGVTTFGASIKFKPMGAVVLYFAIKLVGIL